MSAVPKWKRDLEPFGDVWWKMDQAIAKLVWQMSDDELRELAKACSRPTESNCWSATYRVAPFVLDEVRLTLRERELHAERAV